MKKYYNNIIFILLNYIFSQVAPYESTVIMTDILANKEIQSIYINKDLKDPISIISENFMYYTSKEMTYIEILLEIDLLNTIKLDLISIGINEDSKIFLIDINDPHIVGPFINKPDNFEITLGPIQSSKFILQCIVSKNTNPLNVEFIINKIHDLNSNKQPQKEIYYKKLDRRENPIIIVTGFWPPTNEMIRHFSQDSTLNSSGWQGEDWNELGYDIISFFPEFENPNCNDCGQGYGNFEVDYQDTSSDFWLLIDELDPIAVITFSRGYIDNSWELEYNFYNRTNWINDYTVPFSPTPNPPDSDEASFFLRNSTLPMETIMNTINSSHLGLNSYIDWSGDPGHFVSEFMGYHGVWFRDLNQFNDVPCYLAGHVHVGGEINWDIARQAAEITISEVIENLEEYSYTPGDVNSDGNIDVLDLVGVIAYILGTSDLPGSSLFAADMNSDGIINIQDIILIINLILSNF